jgi:hypothetical protein
MGELHLDSCAEKYGSMEEYVERCFRERIFLQLENPKSFSSFEKEGLVGEGMIVRTSNFGDMDKCYRVDGNGRFTALNFAAYPLREGVYSFAEVFAKGNIGDGYTLEWKKLRGRFREWQSLNKK